MWQHRPALARLRRLFWSVYGRYVWDRQRTPLAQVPIRRIVALLGARATRAGERVLDAGCGTGDYAIALAQAGFKVTGVDYASGMLVRARSKVADTLATSVSFRLASLDEPLPFPDRSFEHSILVGALQAVADPRFTLGQVWRTLAPGGTLVVAHYPRPHLHTLPLLDEVRTRLARAGSNSPLTFALIAMKSWAERAGQTRYWTPGEIEAMLRDSGFRVVTTETLPPIVVVAKKAPAGSGQPLSATEP
jgi:ubiquinone/menaquinone biosynthesis C-methylase UbiE